MSIEPIELCKGDIIKGVLGDRVYIGIVTSTKWRFGVMYWLTLDWIVAPGDGKMKSWYYRTNDWAKEEVELVGHCDD